VLARLVREAADVRPGETALDLHAGVGLFAASLAAAGAAVTAVEAHPTAVADAEVNLQGDAEVVQADAEEYVARLAAQGAWREVVVLDPPRRGAGQRLAASIAALEPRVIVYVSCDPAALARDAATLAAEGYALTRAVPVDQFAQTAQIETVASFNRL
jgi:tRNA/tmRNA/rRNA uracil-C5-methylase (TrmA/RlmC/RlmD family)